MIRISDNNCSTISNRQDFLNLQRIANRSIDKIQLEKMPNLLVFPQEWQMGLKQHYGEMPKICSVSDESEKYIITTGNVMGFIGITDGDGFTTDLSICSRFYPNGNDYFLHYMLAKVLNINIVNLDLSKGTGDYYDFLPYLFPSSLKEALSQGLFRQYRQFNRNDANVRGVVDVSRHIRQNSPFAGKIAYRTREHSCDNSITQLIRHTIEHLRTRSIGQCVLNSDDDTRQNVAQIEYATPTYNRADRSKIIRDNSRPSQHPYYYKYRNLQILCNSILRQERTNFGDEKNQIHGILFDGAWLWEEYLGLVVKAHFDHFFKNKKPKWYLFEGKRQQIIPDYLSKDKTIVADAKYIPLDKNDRYGEDSAHATAIYYKTITYMYRWKAKQGYLLYPCSDNCKTSSYKIKDTEGSITKLGLAVPLDAPDFRSFVGQMNENEKIFLQHFHHNNLNTT